LTDTIFPAKPQVGEMRDQRRRQAHCDRRLRRPGQRESQSEQKKSSRHKVEDERQRRGATLEHYPQTNDA
jgi:hypothetical protein